MTEEDKAETQQPEVSNEDDDKDQIYRHYGLTIERMNELIDLVNPKHYDDVTKIEEVVFALPLENERRCVVAHMVASYCAAESAYKSAAMKLSMLETMLAVSGKLEAMKIARK